MRLTGAAEYDNRDRTYQEVVTTRETTIWGKAAAQPTEKITTSLKLAHAWRDNTTYGTSIWFGYAENPLMRKFNLADRRRNSAEAHVDWAINEKVSLGVSADCRRRRLQQLAGRPHVGAQRAISRVELSVAISEKTHGARLRADPADPLAPERQRGVRRRPTGPAACKDQFDTLGVGIKHTAIENKLDLGADSHVLALAQRHRRSTTRSAHRPSRPRRRRSTA